MEKIIFAGCLCLLTLLSGCGGSGEASNGSTQTTQTTSSETTSDVVNTTQEVSSTTYVNGHLVTDETNEYGVNPELGTPPVVPET